MIPATRDSTALTAAMLCSSDCACYAPPQQALIRLLYLVQILELCRGGELFDRIVEQGTFTERKAAGVCPACGTPSILGDII